MTNTIEDIAKKLKISAMTVSRALNNKYGVKPSTKEKILKLARELNYKPNHIARSLVTNKSYTIGLVLPDITASFFPEIAKGIENIADKYSYSVILCHTQENREKESKQIEILMQKRVDGLIIATSSSKNKLEIYDELVERKIPFVLIDRYIKGFNCNFVGYNDFKAAHNITEYLIKNGHRRIMHSSGPQDISTGWDRLRGYRKTLKNNNVDYEKIISSGVNEESGYNGAKKAFDSGQLPDAIFGFNDLVCIGIIEFLKEKKIKIPEDISIAGFANLKESKCYGLTTVEQPKQELGEVSAELLLEQITKKNKSKKTIIMETSPVIRSSVKKNDRVRSPQCTELD